MSRQSTNHILLIKPASFYSNEQTAGTNLYQHSNQEKDKDEILKEALIEFHHFEHLLKENGILVTTLQGQEDCPDNIYPNWFITFENKKVPVKLRLKGDRITHYNEKNKTSYKVEVLADEKIKGIKKFSFIKPRARNYIHEWLFHELSGVGKLIKLKYEFIYLKINGENHGLYVFEENFDKFFFKK